MERRSFLKLATHGMGVLFAGVLGFPAIAFLIDPRNREPAKRDFRPVAKMSDLQREGTLTKDGKRVLQAVVRDERWDAWNYDPNVVIGRVWLVAPGQKDPIDAFQAICPHLGCSVDYKSDKQEFHCPCHTGCFALNGTKISGPPDRGMDPLQVRTDPNPDDPADPLICVRYEEFEAEKAKKISKTRS
jgi:Rieske Fe-S protein